MTNLQQRRDAFPAIAVIIVNYRTAELALRAAMALAGERAQLPGLRLVIVDGNSGDDSIEILENGIRALGFGDWIEVLPLAINGGFGWANNQAILKVLQGDDPPDYIHILNPDTEIEPGAVLALADVLDRQADCAVVGSQLVNPDGSNSGSAFRFPSLGREFLRGVNTPALGRLLGIAPTLVDQPATDHPDWVTGASMMVRSRALQETGLFDTGFFLYFEEVEMMFRMQRRGWKIRHAPNSRVRHIGGVSTKMTYNLKLEGWAPALPEYWFASRRRCLALILGKWATCAAGMMWLLGHALYRMRRGLGFAGGHVPNRGEGRSLLRYGIVPRAFDLTPHIADWQEPPGQPPAWMAPDKQR